MLPFNQTAGRRNILFAGYFPQWKTIAGGLMLLLFFAGASASAQELYVSTEPASNMATGSLGLRMNTRLFKMEGSGATALRLDPEAMIGVTRRIMVHVNAYGSNMYQPAFRFEGVGAYAKYRFYSVDDVHSHFRMAAFGRISAINNPPALKDDQSPGSYRVSDEIDLEGNNSGWSGGLVATQLLHKLALSATVASVNRWKNIDHGSMTGQSAAALNYSVSAGLLLFPRQYRDFHQTNLNVYCEFLGSSSLDKKGYYFDVAPAIQLIFNSISRLDFSYRTQWAGHMERLSKSSFMVRYEYNFLNLFKQRS